MEQLKGGRENSVFRDSETVIRPFNPWTTTIHRLLEHFHSQGLTECPTVIKVTSESEVLSYVEGDTYNYPLMGPIASTTALQTAAQLLKKLHDASLSFVDQNNIDDLPWMLPIKSPVEVICHGDFTPYNVALSCDEVTGVFDFDTAHPAPRVWDVAFSIYCWAPFKTDSVDSLGTFDDQLIRAKLFCDCYGLEMSDREKVVDVMIERIQSLVNYMAEQANNGDVHFQKNILDGHHLAYRNDIEFLKQYKPKITRYLIR
ncbi:aminoglycoside phosphotransferase family protein [Vibrio kyushuensis]|uniref:aminoglycoside phosphotransferase family protein n=1 Tax=Vibrio kyushuensis TaxID=2910249 RepID=UPI003D0FF1D1